jgi:predicted PurR-regulated permease PerM
MPSNPAPLSISRVDLIALTTAFVLMVLILKLHLLAALISGLLVHELIHSLAQRLRVATLGRESAKVVAVALVATVVVTLLAIAILNLLALLRHGSDGLPALLGKLAEAIDNSRSRLPSWLVESLPNDAEELRTGLVELLRKHGSELQGFGKSFSRGLAHILIGMIVGAMLALRKTTANPALGPLSHNITEHTSRLASAFRNVVFAQTWIATLNTLFTWLYLGVALPLFGVHLPQVKTLVVVTWVAGLLPIIGNLISNTIIVIVSLSDSLQLALASLLFLIVVHKLEYFMNARIIGSKIRARAWELLIVMLVMETAFGITGLIAAPIFYAYFKEELTRLRLI